MKRASKRRKYLKRVRNIAYLSKKSTNDCYLRVSGLVSTLKIACSMFRMHNAMKTAFERRKYLKRVRNIALLSTKSTNDCDFGVSGHVSKREIACAMFRTHNAMKTAFKRRKYLKRVRNIP